MSGAEMANKAEEVMATVLQKAMEVAEKTGDFVTDQAPDVVQQLLAWKFVQASLYATVALVVVAASVYGIWRFIKCCRERNDDMLEFVLGVLSIGGAATGLPALITNMGTALQIWLAPKVYLIEYTANLIK